MKNALWYVLAGLCLAGQAALGQLVPVPHVDTFTGTFTTSVPVVTIPGPHGGGFTVQLTYSSDVKAEEEASIVGYGWSLNIPTITRAKMGFPDDVKEGEVIYEKKDAFRSQALSIRGAQEFIALDADKLANVSAGLALCATCSDGTGLDAFATVSSTLGIAQPGLGSYGVGAAVNTKGLFSSSLSAFGSAVNIYSYDPQSRISPVPFGAYKMDGYSVSGTLTVRMGVPGAGVEGGWGYTTTAINPVKELRQIYSGYLYTPLVTTDSATSVVMDYLTERDRPVGIDNPAPLPVPIPAPDKFIVSAPEISGTFRVHHPLPLRLRPAEVESLVKYAVASGKVIGPSPGGGIGTALPIPVERKTHYGDILNDDYMQAFNNGPMNFGLSTQYRLMTEWRRAGLAQPPVFRYENDPADVVRYTPSDGPMASWAVGTNGTSQEHYHPANIQGQIRTNRAIAWRTYGEKRVQTDGIYEAGALREPADKGHNQSIAERLAQFTITGESGTTYDFNVPLWSTEEFSRTIVTKGIGLNVPNQRVYYKNGGAIDERPEQREKIDYTTLRSEYASAWMIRSITAPNYVDVDNNGPSYNDKGAWTLFTYQKGIPHNWRSPHNGFLVDRGDVDDKDDDRLSYSYGTQYTRNVRTIETATHIAEFVMNTVDTSTYPTRKDAYPRWENEAKAQASPSAHGTDATEGNPSEYLVMIRLYTNQNGTKGKLLQTVHFQYDYSLMPGNPSSAAGAGKLTLRRMWVENRDVKDATINPVTFNYAYPSSMPTGALDTRYPAALPLPSTLVENPSFDANKIDAWGYQQGVQPHDVTQGHLETMRHTPLQSWQTAPTDDPAAWRLKSIGLPTGGSIVVSYEARTYRHVQDKPAMFLGTVTSGKDSGATFTVDLESLGAPSGITYAQAQEYAAMVREQFVDRGEPVYYDMLYRTPACLSGPPGYNHARGYGRLVECAANSGTPNLLTVKFGAPPTFKAIRTWDNIDNSIRHLPLRTTVRQWKTYDQRGCVCDGSATPLDIVSYLGLAGLDAISILVPVTGFDSMFDLQEELSLLRLPMYADKTGGGVRVKRLLSVSPEGSLEDGDAAAVGAEYLYDETLPDGKVMSTGVAVNEPWKMRPENAIVGIDVNEWPAVDDHVFDAHDMWRAEGPIGFTIMPGGSIGYRRVTVRGINRNDNSMPHSVYTYLTARDIPPVAVKNEPITVEKSMFNNDQFGFYSNSRLDLRLSQSFMIENRPYHGLLSMVETYAPPTASGTTSLLASTKYEYAAPDEQVLLYDTLTRALRYTRFGDYEDLVFEGRTVTDKMEMYHFDFSLEVIPIFPFFLPGIAPAYANIDHQVRTYATTKILTRTPILRRMVSFDRGAIDTVETFAYDRVTRLPAVYKGKDIYHGSISAKSVPTTNHVGTIHTVRMPAHRVYSHMGQKSIGHRYVFGVVSRPVPGLGTVQVTTYPVLVVTPPAPPPPQVVLTGVKFAVLGPADSTSRIAYIRSMFTVGDVLSYKMRNPTTGAVSDSSLYMVTAVADSARSVFCSLASIGVPTARSVSGGQPVFTRIRSGKTNQLTSVAGSIALYGVDDSHILQRARELRDLESIADNFTLGTRTDNRYEPFKHFSPDYEYRAFQFTAPAKKLTSTDWNRPDSCNASISRYANAQLTGTGSTYMIVSMGISDRDTVLGCLCTTSWKNCSNPWLVLSGGVPAKKTYREWDRWSRFRASDKGDLTIATYAVPATVAVDSLTFHDGNFGCVPSLYTPFASPETCGTPSPAFSSVLEMASVSYTPRDPTVNTGVPRKRIYEPFASWSYGTSAVLDGSSGAIGSYARTGSYPVSGTPPPMWSLWYVAPSAYLSDAGILAAMPSDTNHQGWMRSAYVIRRSDNGIPVEVVGERGDTSSIQMESDGYTPRALFTYGQYGEAYVKNFEFVTCANCVEKAHTGRYARRLNGSSLTETVSDALLPFPSNRPPDSRPMRVQFWVRPTDSLSTVPVRNNLIVDGDTVGVDDSVACVHGWRLYDMPFTYGDVRAAVTITAKSGNDFLIDDVSISNPVGGKTMLIVDDQKRITAMLGNEHLPVRAYYDIRGALAKTVAVTEHGWLAEGYSDGHLPEWARTTSLTHGGTNYQAMMAMPFDPLRDVYNNGRKMRTPTLKPQLQKMQGKGTILDTKIDTDGIRTTSPLEQLLPSPPPSDDITKPETKR